jgi:hypothetical protein
MNKFFQRRNVCTTDSPANDDSQSPTYESSLGAELITLRVSLDDVHWASRTGLQKPMLLSLQRATGTLWHLYPNGLALEIMSPHRACQFPDAIHLDCQEWAHLLEQGDCEYQVQLLPTQEREGYSLIQRRAVTV